MKFFQAMLGLFLRLWHSKGYVTIISLIIPKGLKIKQQVKKIRTQQKVC